MRITIDISNTYHKSYAIVSNYAGFDITEEKWQLMLGRKFITDLVSIVKKFNNVKEVIFAFDSDNYFRKQIRADYKAGRTKKEQEFYDLLNELELVLKNKGFSTLNVNGLEADDLLVLIAGFSDMFNVLVSNDEDIRQSVDSNTVVYTANNSNLKIFHSHITVVAQNLPELICLEHGVNKKQIFYEKLFLGCSGDNVARLLPKGQGPAKVKKIIELIETENDIKNALNSFGYDISQDLIEEQMKMVCLGQDYIPEKCYEDFVNNYPDNNITQLEFDMKKILENTRFIQ